jgi:mannose-6-phosphate isomerase-like protein (cupin superfamily)
MNYVFKTSGCKRYSFPTHRNDLVVDRKDAACSEVIVVTVEPGKAVHRHSHKTVEQVFYILEGTGILTVGAGGKEYAVRPTLVVRVPPGTVHTLRAKGGKPVRYLCVDCFCGSKPAREPTWDDHAKAICKEQGYDYNRITASRIRRKKR